MKEVLGFCSRRNSVNLGSRGNSAEGGEPERGPQNTHSLAVASPATEAGLSLILWDNHEEEELRNLTLEGERNKKKEKQGEAGESHNIMRESPKPARPATSSLLLPTRLILSPIFYLNVSLALRVLWSSQFRYFPYTRVTNKVTNAGQFLARMEEPPDRVFGDFPESQRGWNALCLVSPPHPFCYRYRSVATNDVGFLRKISDLTKLLRKYCQLN